MMYKLDMLCGAQLENVIYNDYIGIDIEKPTKELMEQHMGQSYNIDELISQKKFFQLDVNVDELPFPDNSVIEIVSYSGIGRGYVKKFSEIMRVLHPEGNLILYNAYFKTLPKLMRLFIHIDIKFMNGHRHQDSPENGYDFKFNCYEPFDDFVKISS